MHRSLQNCKIKSNPDERENEELSDEDGEDDDNDDIDWINNESCSDSGTESSEDENDVPDYNFVADTKDTILNNQDITLQNALNINKKLQEFLQMLKSKLETLLADCEAKYNANENILNSETKNNLICFKPRIFSCRCYGIPFFKNKEYYSPPPNEDYIYRKKHLKEFFPIDYEEKRTTWTLRDKLFLIQEVKRQIVKYLLVKEKEKNRVARLAIREKSKTIKQTIEAIDANAKFNYMQLDELLDKVKGTSFTIDWEELSSLNDDRHLPDQCMALWNGYLMPHLNRKPWTKDEEDILYNAVDLFNQQDWFSISKLVPNRSSYQCFVHYQNNLFDRTVLKNVKWTKEEDNLLIKTIEEHRVGTIIPWAKIVEKIPGRNRPQIYHRYMFSIKPGIKKDKFTIDEDCVIVAAVKEYGTNFNMFPFNLLPGRTNVQIRNRYNNVLKNVGKTKFWTYAKDQELFKLVEEYGTANWSQISKILKDYTRFSCRTRYQTIIKYLQQHKDKKLKDVPRKNRTQATYITMDNYVNELGHRNNSKSEIVTDKNGKGALALEFYNYFKYTYAYSYMKKKPNKCTYENQRVISELLNSRYTDICNLNNTTLENFSFGKHVKIEEEYTNLLKDYRDNKNIVLPPSWCTTVGMRALTIMFAKSKLQLYKPLLSNADCISDYKKADELFRKRFFTLFYSSALLTKLKIIEFPPTEKQQQQLLQKQPIEQATVYSITSAPIESSAPEISTIGIPNIKKLPTDAYTAESSTTATATACSSMQNVNNLNKVYDYAIAIQEDKLHISLVDTNDCLKPITLPKKRKSRVQLIKNKKMKNS